MKIKLIVSLIIVLLFSFASSVIAKDKVIYFFYGNGCPHCAKVESYFEDNDLFRKYPIEKKEIYSNKENSVLFNSVMDQYQVPQNQRGVPSVVLGNKVLIGDRPIIRDFTKEADIFLRTQVKVESTSVEKSVVADNKDLTILAVIIGAMVDAINPCEFAVLIILMSTVLANGNAKKSLATGLAFSASIFISYFLMGIGLYSALSWGSVTHIFYIVAGWLAIVLGLLNLKDYFWYGKGFLMEVPLSWRPRLKSLIHSVTSPAGAFAVGFLVSLFLLPCTSGPYVVILGMLAQKVQLVKTIFYLLLYNLIFVSPMILISYVVYKGYDPDKAERIRQRRLRTMHLVAGVVMTILGTMIVLGWI